MKIVKEKLELMNIMDQLFHHIIPIKINGKIGKLLVDTGASRTVFDYERFKRFKHKGKMCLSPSPTAVAGSIVNAHITIMKSFTICNNVNVKNYLAGIIDLSHINNMLTSYKAEPIDGILGNDFLMTYGATIDFANNKIQMKFDDKKINKKNLDTLKKIKQVINI